MDGVATVHVVDDSEPARRALSRLLQSAGYRVKEYASAEALLAQPPEGDAPCVVLADLVLPGLDGLGLAAQLSATAAAPPVVFLTACGGVPSSVRATKQGAIDFLEKPVRAPVLLEALERAVARSRYGILERRQLANLRSHYAALTPREREVFALVVSGLLNKQVAAQLGVTEKTVKVHRSRVVAKMEALSLRDLVRMAERLGVGSRQKAGDSELPGSSGSRLPPG